MIDLHSHFLPEIDDGAQDPSESIEMLRYAFSQGVTKCVATPHAIIHESSDIDRFLSERKESYELLLEKLSEYGSEVPEIILGAEVYLDNDLSRYQSIEQLCIGDTRALLIEFPTSKSFNHKAEEWLYSLNRMGITPIVAHIDRYLFWQELINSLSGLRVSYQVNASVLLTFSGRRIFRKLTKYSYPYIISSDMHDMSSRKCNMKAAYQKAQKKYADIADKLFITNAESILCSNAAHK